MPSGGLIGALRVTLGLDAADFQKGAKSAEDRAEAMGRKIGISLRSAAGSALELAEAFTGLGAAVGVTAIGAAAARALDLASALGETAQQLGVTTKDLQEYRYAASQVGISQDEMDQGLRKLTLSMGQARDGVDKPKKAFAELSELLGKDVLTSAQTAGDAIPLIADALAKVQDPAQRAALEVELFGKTGQKLDTLLAGGSDSVNELRDAAQSLGLVLSEDEIQSADQTADKLSELKLVLEADIAHAVTQNSDAIFTMVDALEKLAMAGPAAVNGLGKLRAYMNLGMGFLNGDQAEMDAARQDLTMRNAFGKRSWMDDQRDSVARYAAAHMRGAGAGTSDAEEAKAGREAASAARKAAADAKRAAADAARKAKARADEQGRFDDEMSRMVGRQYDLESQMTSSLEDRAAYEMKRIDLEQEAYNAGLQRQVEDQVDRGVDRKVAEAHAHKLRLANAFNANYERDLVNQRLEEDQRKASLELRKGEIDLEREALEHGLDGARTQAERRRIQLDLLDLAYEQRRLEQEAVLASTESTAKQKELARATLAKLDAFHAADTANVERQTMGPLASYLDQMPKTAAEVNEAFEKIATDGLQSLNDGLVDAIMNGKSLGDMFGSITRQIVADLLKIEIEKYITRPLAEALNGGGSGSSSGGGGFGGILSSLFGGSGGGGGDAGSSALAALFGQGNGVTSADAVALPGMATGGAFDIRSGAGGIDRNILSLNGQPKVRVNYGERVTVTPANDAGPAGKSITFDMRGAVVTEDLLQQMDVIASDRAATVVGAAGKRAGMRGKASLIRG